MIKIILALAIAAQLFIPASMISRYQSTLSDGKAYRFAVIPVDPVDPFRGRYVQLNFGRQHIPYNGDSPLKRHSIAYASLRINSNGLAETVELFAKKPTSGDFVNVKVGYADAQEYYYVRFLFDRYYATESKAPKIETALSTNQAGLNDQQVIAQVNIKNGLGVINELYIGDQTIHQFLHEKAKK